MKDFSIKIPSIIDNIKIVESFIDNVKEKYCINDDKYGNIMIAVTESVTNAIIHGNQGEKHKAVILSVSDIEGKICFSVQDEGIGFDFTNISDPTSPENLEKPGGRGIFLISNLCDNYSFENSGKTIKMYFQIP